MVQRILEAGDIESLDHNAIPRLLLPQAAAAFTARAARLRQLAKGDVTGTPVGATLSGYLMLMAALVDAQAAVSVALPKDAVTLPPLADMQQAHAHHMPLIPVERRARSGVAPDFLQPARPPGHHRRRRSRS